MALTAKQRSDLHAGIRDYLLLLSRGPAFLHLGGGAARRGGQLAFPPRNQLTAAAAMAERQSLRSVGRRRGWWGWGGTGKSPADGASNVAIVPLMMVASAPCAYDQKADGEEDDINVENESGNRDGWDTGARKGGKSPADGALDDGIVPLMVASAPCTYDRETDSEDDIEAKDESGNCDGPWPEDRKPLSQAETNEGKRPFCHSGSTKDGTGDGGREKKKSRGNDGAPTNDHTVMVAVTASPRCAYDKKTDDGDSNETDDESGNRNLARHCKACESHPGVESQEDERRRKINEIHEVISALVARRVAKNMGSMGRQEAAHRRKIGEIQRVAGNTGRNVTCPGNNEKDTEERRRLVVRIAHCAESFLDKVVELTETILLSRAQSKPYRLYKGCGVFVLIEAIDVAYGLQCYKKYHHSTYTYISSIEHVYICKWEYKQLNSRMMGNGGGEAKEGGYIR